MSTAAIEIHDGTPPADRGSSLALERHEDHALAGMAPMTFEQIVQMGDALVRTGFLPEHIKNGAQAAAIILTGREMGMQPMRALRSLAMVKGKVTEYADSQLARFKADGGRATWRRLDETTAVLWLRHPNGDEHEETFTLADAERAGLTKPGRNNEPSMYHKHPRAMLRSRAITAGLKSIGWEGGVGNYDPEEAIAFSAPSGSAGAEPTLDPHGNEPNAPATDEPEAKCPKCGGRMWDNRTSKTNPKAPDFKCRDKSCDGAYWPGQWPPAPLATDEQKARIRALLADADLTDDAKNKTERIVANTEKPLTAERAAEIITKLEPLAIAPQLPIDDAATAGSGGPVTMPKGGAVGDSLSPKASGAGLTELTKKITTLLQHEKFKDDERAEFKAKLAKANSLETMQLLVAEIETFLELPF